MLSSFDTPTGYEKASHDHTLKDPVSRRSEFSVSTCRFHGVSDTFRFPSVRFGVPVGRTTEVEQTGTNMITPCKGRTGHEVESHDDTTTTPSPVRTLSFTLSLRVLYIQTTHKLDIQGTQREIRDWVTSCHYL